MEMHQPRKVQDLDGSLIPITYQTLTGMTLWWRHTQAAADLGKLEHQS